MVAKAGEAVPGIIDRSVPAVVGRGRGRRRRVRGAGGLALHRRPAAAPPPRSRCRRPPCRWPIPRRVVGWCRRSRPAPRPRRWPAAARRGVVASLVTVSLHVPSCTQYRTVTVTVLPRPRAFEVQVFDFGSSSAETAPEIVTVREVISRPLPSGNSHVTFTCWSSSPVSSARDRRRRQRHRTACRNRGARLRRTARPPRSPTRRCTPAPRPGRSSRWSGRRSWPRCRAPGVDPGPAVDPVVVVRDRTARRLAGFQCRATSRPRRSAASPVDLAGPC